MATESKNSMFVLDKNTVVPLGLLLTVVAAMTSGALWIQSSFIELKYELESTNHKIQEQILKMNDLKSEIQEKMTDRWSKTEMINFINLLKAKNPSLSIPDIH